MSDGISAGSAQRDWLEVDRDRPDGISAGAAQRDCCWIVFERERAVGSDCRCCWGLSLVRWVVL